MMANATYFYRIYKESENETVTKKADTSDKAKTIYEAFKKSAKAGTTIGIISVLSYGRGMERKSLIKQETITNKQE